MNRSLLERASRMFNSVADLRTEEDQRINEWFKGALAASVPCRRCGELRGSDTHYIGTVDSHEFEESALVGQPPQREHDGGVAETERRHAADCRAQEAQRTRDANALQAEYLAALALPRELRRERPKIICLCGSTRFIEQFAIKTWELELEGHIVLGCTLLPLWYCHVPDHFAESLGVKGQRDEHHLRKIDLADEVLVLNIGGYVGESTRNEIAYAEAHGKPVQYLEPVVAREPRRDAPIDEKHEDVLARRDGTGFPDSSSPPRPPTE